MNTKKIIIVLMLISGFKAHASYPQQSPQQSPSPSPTLPFFGSLAINTGIQQNFTPPISSRSNTPNDFPGITHVSRSPSPLQPNLATAAAHSAVLRPTQVIINSSPLHRPITGMTQPVTPPTPVNIRQLGAQAENLYKKQQFHIIQAQMHAKEAAKCVEGLNKIKLIVQKVASDTQKRNENAFAQQQRKLAEQYAAQKEALQKQYQTQLTALKSVQSNLMQLTQQFESAASQASAAQKKLEADLTGRCKLEAAPIEIDEYTPKSAFSDPAISNPVNLRLNSRVPSRKDIIKHLRAMSAERSDNDDIDDNDDNNYDDQYLDANPADFGSDNFEFNNQIEGDSSSQSSAASAANLYSSAATAAHQYPAQSISSNSHWGAALSHPSPSANSNSHLTAAHQYPTASTSSSSHSAASKKQSPKKPAQINRYEQKHKEGHATPTSTAVNLAAQAAIAASASATQPQTPPSLTPYPHTTTPVTAQVQLHTPNASVIATVDISKLSPNSKQKFSQLPSNTLE